MTLPPPSPRARAALPAALALALAACGAPTPPPAATGAGAAGAAPAPETAMARPDDPRAERVEKPEEEWRRILTPMQYFVTREKGTERAFTGEYWDCHDRGTYRCVACAAPLFTDREKFDSGCGWPSFDRPAQDARIAEHLDASHGMVRTEVTCERCGAHLGHVFPDGPTDTGRRYCINSAALRLEREAPPPSDAPSK